MANFIQAPRGTMDILPEKVTKWQHIETVIRDTARLCGFSELRFPTFEYTELFSRGVGETTDVVQKEMYTFEDRGGRSITLRPEGTASTVRTVLQNGLHNGPMPLKLYYLISCFRGERPQAGRYREFWQFGFEVIGEPSAVVDAQIIQVFYNILKELKLKNLIVEVSDIGNSPWDTQSVAEGHGLSLTRKRIAIYNDKLQETAISIAIIYAVGKGTITTFTFTNWLA